MIALSLVLTLLAAFVGICASVSLAKSLQLQVHGRHADAVIVEHERYEKGVFPVFEFVAEGVSHRVAATFREAASLYPVGKAVRILYLPGAPTLARIDSLDSIYRTPIRLGVAFVVVCPVAVSLCYAQFFNVD